ncbi:MAG: hypothetical protein K8U03_19020 [Planctomycetia bacterium]|nr:hypothetical protein [Planctomycetia bacterium]
MKNIVSLVAGSLAFALCLLVAGSASAQGDAEVEAKFVATLKNATLKGSWAPVAGGKLGAEKGNDSYRIARAEKSSAGQWSIVSLYNVGGRQVEFPISASVKFAGDTAVLILDDVRAGPGAANWSARVMFHNDVYAGRWWATADPEHGGTINGTITRAP